MFLRCSSTFTEGVIPVWWTHQFDIIYRCVWLIPIDWLPITSKDQWYEVKEQFVLPSVHRLPVPQTLATTVLTHRDDIPNSWREKSPFRKSQASITPTADDLLGHATWHISINLFIAIDLISAKWLNPNDEKSRAYQFECGSHSLWAETSFACLSVQSSSSFAACHVCLLLQRWN